MKKLVLISVAVMIFFTVSAQNERRSKEYRKQGNRVSTYSSRESEIGKSSKTANSFNRNRGHRDYKENKSSHFRGTHHPRYHAYKKSYKKHHVSKPVYHTHHSKKHYKTHYVNRNHNRIHTVRLRVLPNHYNSCRVNGDNFYYCSGVFYRHANNYYEPIIAPVGAIVYNLPYGVDRISIDGRVYYEYYDTIYKKIETERGDAYEVVGQLN